MALKKGLFWGPKRGPKKGPKMTLQKGGPGRGAPGRPAGAPGAPRRAAEISAPGAGPGPGPGPGPGGPGDPPIDTPRYGPIGHSRFNWATPYPGHGGIPIG